MEYDDFGSPHFQLHQLVYDGLGRLRQAVDYIHDDSIGDWVPSGVKNYIYDGWGVIQERDENNGGYYSGGVGLGMGAHVSGGLNFSASNAKTICDLSGPFANGTSAPELVPTGRWMHLLEAATTDR